MTPEIRWFVASVDAREGDTADGRKRPPPRTWCFFRTREEAEQYVREHVYSLSEGRYYTHAVIEPHACASDPGPRPDPRESYWFKLTAQKRTRLGDRGLHGYAVEPKDEDDLCEPCEKPDKYKQIVGFTM